MARSACLVVVALFVQLTGGKDLYWARNTNWDEPSNWALGRVPCGGDTVTLPNNAVTFLNNDVTVGSIVLPEDGVLILKPSVTIRLAEDSECSVPADTKPMAADVKENKFLAPTRYWECAENWVTEPQGDLPAEHSPCGEDNAIFETGFTFSVAANESITVRSITVRGNKITSSKDELDQREFNLDIKIEPECGKSPYLCPCPTDSGCPKNSAPTVPDIPKPAKNKGNPAGMAVGIVVVIIVLAVVTLAVIILAVVIYGRYKRSRGYTKDDLLEDQLGPDTHHFTQEERSDPKRTKKPTADTTTFDNPVYDSNILRADEIDIIGYETKISEDGENIEPTLEYDFDTKEAIDQGKGKKPVLYEYEKL